ncbi:MAG: hypothetical protein JRI23_01220 [Deltaproteobacteria bacterium]|nr:hypothetical protein [Deltaproteobacteria bacterium]MBW2530075.1 hypothetical protein [Deltaproteobacteria bacterium]
MSEQSQPEGQGATSAVERTGAGDYRRALRGALLAIAWVGLAACGRPPRIVEAKGGYFAFGNVEAFQRGPEVLAIESSITAVQYAVLLPLGAAVIAAIVSGYAWWRNRSVGRRSDWALPLGSAVLATLLAFVGKNATTTTAVIDQNAGKVEVEQGRGWGVVPTRTETRLADVVSVQVVYRAGRGAYCASMLRRRSGEPSEVALFEFVDMLTDKVDLATCERLQARIASALGDVPRGGPVELK